MDPFKTIHSQAAVLAQADIDTDLILPAQFLLRIDREGLGNFVFHSLRQDVSNPFVLDTPPYNDAKIIIGGPRFGIGSSREQAVWSLVDFGIRCIIAPSFGEIFHANCAKNGILAITLDGEDYAAVKERALATNSLTIRLNDQTITYDGAPAIPFDVDASIREALESGRDETDLILQDDGADILAFEKRHYEKAPWLELSGGQLASYFAHLKPKEST